MSNTADQLRCGLCGERPAQSKITFSHDPPPEHQQKHSHSDPVALEMDLCVACGDRALKHLKRIFTRKQLGLSRRSKW